MTPESVSVAAPPTVRLNPEPARMELIVVGVLAVIVEPLDSVIVPRTANLISVRRPGRLVLAVVIADRSDPGPALPSLVTVRVRA